jgi:succinate dehydrogenase/fumarate reductase flavoprotein subunit
MVRNVIVLGGGTAGLTVALTLKIRCLSCTCA